MEPDEHPPEGQLTVNSVASRLVFRVSSLWTVLAIIVALVGALSATVPLLTNFATYDDEGYMLVSLVHYISEGHLYTQTFSQYGPFYFYAQGLFFELLHFPVTHDMGRLVTLGYWVASGLFATAFVYRLSKSMSLACAAGLCVMLTGQVLANQPGHPQQVILLLYMIAAYLSLLPFSERYYVNLFLIGCLGAAFVFTKVNVGVFYIVGTAYALICLLSLGRIRSIGIGLALIYAAAFPWILMHAHFNRGFSDYFLLATVAGIVTFSCGALVRPHQCLPMRATLCSGAGLMAGTALIIVVTSVQGISIGSLFWGVILNALSHPDTFAIPLPVGRRVLLAALVLTASIVGLISSGRCLVESRWLDMLRCAVGIGAALLLTLGTVRNLVHYQIQLVVPLLPLTLIPQSHWRPAAVTLFHRMFITYMAITQFLEPYPVAGSQVAIAAAPMILWAFLCIADGITGIRVGSRMPSKYSGETLRLDGVIGGTILVVCAAASVTQAARRPFPPASIGLRGSEWLHLPVEQARKFESLSRDISVNCDTLFTMPGMGSFNIWSGVPTPNGWFLTFWMKGLSTERQAEILSIMKSDLRVCAILNRSMVRFWTEDEAFLASLPLADYIMNDMTKITEIGEYEILVHPNRSLPWFDVRVQERRQ
jgi:hypothetical protein